MKVLIVEQCTDGPDFGFLGDPGVNVLRLNLALDNKYAVPPPPASQPAPQMMDRLTIFGLMAVSLMLLFYALESRARIYILAFAGSCILGATD